MAWVRRHHLRVHVADVAVLPVGHLSRGIGGHDLAVRREALPVEGRLDEAPLAQPEVALGEQEAVSQEPAQQANAQDS